MRPDEGWVSLPLVLLLTGTMAWSIADARWILGQDNLTSFLIWIALAASAWGYLSARLDISPWLAQALGCAIGAFILIEAIGASLPNSGFGLGSWFQATSTSVTQAYLDLTWRHQPSTLQVGHFCLLLGVLVWGTAQAAAYDIFGYHRSVNGVLLLAVVLIANMALTYNDQFGGLVVFSAAALVLLLLSHAADERSSWLRHRIWRGRDFETPHLEGGLAFASVAVAGSLILTMVASSAPLGSVMEDLSSGVQNALSGLSGYLPGGGVSRIQGSSDFGSTMSIQPIFNEATRDVFTVRVQSVQAVHHWRMYAYDTFQGTKWSVGSDTRKDNVLAGGQLDGGTLDLVSANASSRKPVTVTVHILDTSIKHLIVPNEPDNVNAGVERTLVGSAPSNSNVATFTSNAKDYTVVAYVPDIATDGTGLTEWRLQHAGTAFPPDLLARYTQGVSLVGSDGRGLLAEIKKAQTANGFDNEYDVAKAIQTYLHGPSFTYNTDISAKMPRCAGLSTVDCFAYIREGFCEHYATTMTMLMRMQGYPARFVQGYLPGATDPHTLVERVTTQQKHSWVEVYFPTYGWIPFDPTGGGVGAPTVLAPGSAVVATPTPSTSLAPDDTGAISEPTPTASSVAAGSTKPDDNVRPLFLVPLLLVAVLLLALFVLWRRRSRRLEGPDAVYRNVVKLATRLGYRPRPTQTVFEYTGMLADIVPQARDSLGIVAVATTEVTYGRQQLSTERLVFLATAHHIVRQALLGLAFRLPRLRRGGKGAGATAGRKGTTGRTRS